MATIQGAKSELVDVVSNIQGIIFAPDQPTETPAVWPFAMGFVSEMISMSEPNTHETSKHDLTFVVAMPVNDYRHCELIMLPLWEPIVNKLWAHRNGRTSSHYQTFDSIQGRLGDIPWDGSQSMYGYTINIFGVKIQNVIS